MEIYILKSSVCLAVFFLFYKLFLEKENMHVFKRYYLLAALFLAFTIPLITFTTYIEIPTQLISQTTTPVLLESQNFQPEAIATNYLPIILWSIYGLGVLFFGIKFVFNLLQLGQKIKQNPKQRERHFTNVLLSDLTSPHTFFKYIFLNKQKFESQQIPKEVFWHEQSHAEQKHTLDIIFIELLQVVFWFNPLIYIIKHAIKLNHEFLADQAVLNMGVSTSIYQKILLAFSSNTNHPQLTNAINYSSIKKRFTVMKTQTSTRAIWLRSIVLLPLLAILIYSFSTKTIVENEIINISELPVNEVKLVKSWFITIDNIKYYYTFDKDERIARHYTSDGKLVNLDIIKEYKRKYATLKKLQSQGKHYVFKSEDKRKEIDMHFSDLGGMYYRMDRTAKNTVERPINSIEPYVRLKDNKGETYFKKRNELTENEIKSLPKLLPPPAPKKTTASVQDKTIKIVINKNGEFSVDDSYSNIEKFTKRIEGFTSDEKKELVVIVKTADNTPIEKIEAVKTVFRKNNILKVNFTTYKSSNNNATSEQIAEYNKLAKKYNSQPKNNMHMLEKDVEKLHYLYDLMSLEQRRSAEPFPNFPPPPPAPQVPQVAEKPATPISVTNVSASKLPSVSQVPEVPAEAEIPEAPSVNQEKELPPPPPPPIPNNATEEQRLKYQKTITEYEQKYGRKAHKITDENGMKINVVDINETTSLLPPPPPPTESPLDYVIIMAKRDAQFIYKGKIISSDEAIDIMKKNQKMNIQTKYSDSSKQPIVYLSTEPIVIETDE